nr:ABC transporter permease [Gemmatimonadaceae bacterium]MCU0634728.1 ABC transporter permease [Gemmatimonadaceae bacterium]
SVAKEFESTGPTTFFISRYPITFESCDDNADETCTWRNNPPIRMNEVDALRRLGDAEAVGVRLDWSASAKLRDRTLKSVSIEGYSADWARISAPEMKDGRAFTEQEVRSGATVAVINHVMAERLYGDGDPFGKEFTLNGMPFRVIGVYQDNSSFLSGADRPKAVVPITAAVRYLDAQTDWIGVAVKPRATVTRDEMVDQVNATMRAVRGLRPRQNADFAIITQDQLFDVYNKVFGMFFLVMIALSAVGLLVGGVGVVAIMTISVTERTREIGVRKALGATRGTILWQFLAEAITLTGIGALIGLGIGWLIALVVRNTTPVPAEIPPLAVLAAVGSSIITGIGFGIVPASRAARLDPVEALRYE